MIIEEFKKIKSVKSELRKFGITVGIALGLLGGLFLWRGRYYFFYFFILSLAILFFGSVMPIILKPIHKVWMTFAILMGWLVSRIILIVLFYLVVTPIGFLFRMFGKEFLDLTWDKSKLSYWKYRRIEKVERSKYEKQF